MKSQTKKRLRSYFADLALAPRTKIKDIERIRRDSPFIGGIYAIWNGAGHNPLYVGETCHINHRLVELSSLGRHVFFMTYVKNKNIPAVAPAKSGHSAWSRLTVSWLPMEIGRAELEDFLVGTFEPKYNSKPVRLRMREDAADFQKPGRMD